ncbi:hypothetical protein E2320_020002, partial [Naja naja]
LSRFKEIVGKIHTPVPQEAPIPQESAFYPPSGLKFPGIPPDLSNMHLQIPAPVPSRVGSDSEESEKSEIYTPVEQIEFPALTVVSSRPHSSGSSSDRENLEQKITRRQISHVSETSLSSSGGIVAEFSESGDSEPPPFLGPRSKILLKERSVAEAPALDYLPKPIELPSKTSKESFSVSEIPVRISDKLPLAECKDGDVPAKGGVVDNSY